MKDSEDDILPRVVGAVNAAPGVTLVDDKCRAMKDAGWRAACIVNIYTTTPLEHLFYLYSQ